MYWTKCCTWQSAGRSGLVGSIEGAMLGDAVWSSDSRAAREHRQERRDLMRLSKSCIVDVCSGPRVGWTKKVEAMEVVGCDARRLFGRKKGRSCQSVRATE